MKKIIILLAFILLLASQIFSDENNNESNVKPTNKYYQIARTLYPKPFGKVLSLPFTWLGNLVDEKNKDQDTANLQELENSEVHRKLDFTNWSQLSLRYFTNDADNDIEIVTGASQDADKINTEGKFGVQYKHEVSAKINDKFSISVFDDIFFSEKSHERRNSFFTNDLRLGVLFQHNNTYLKLKLNNRYYDSGETNYLSLLGIAQHTQQQMVNSAVINFKRNFGKFGLNLYSNFRDLEYRYLVLDEDDDNSRDDDEEFEYDEYSASDYDSYTNAELSYLITDHLTVFSRLYYKDDLNETSLYDMTNYGGGLEYDNKINLFSSIKAELQYYNNISDEVNTEKDHNLVTKLRYSRRFRNGVSGFVSYINRSCYDNETSTMYRVSNMLRIHAMYSYSLENQNNSYILAGIKYNPENDGTLGFIEQNQYLFNGLYSTANIKYSLDIFTSYSFKMEYFINNLQSLWIKDELIDYYGIHKQNLVFIGSTMIF